MQVAIIIPVHNRKYVTLGCLDQLRRTISGNIFYDIIVIDDGSTDGTHEAIRQYYPEVILLEGDGNLWWAGGVNQGLKHIQDTSSCDYILILNDDTVFFDDTLQNLLRCALKHGERTVCSPLVIDQQSGRIYNAGRKRQGLLQKLRPQCKGEYPGSHFSETIDCDSVGTRFALMPRGIIHDVGYFDQDKFPHGYSDIEYFLRAKRAGYKILVVTNSRVCIDQNRNYIQHRLVSSPLLKYLKSFFEKRYENNIKLMFYESFLHRPFLIGCLHFLNAIFSHARWIIYKIILPTDVLHRIVKAKWVNYE